MENSFPARILGFVKYCPTTHVIFFDANSPLLNGVTKVILFTEDLTAARKGK
jgi:hypothetical protein